MMQKLDDSVLAGISGGAGSQSGKTQKTVRLQDLEADDLQYYIMGICPTCKIHKLDLLQGKFCCGDCAITYIE